MRLLPYNSPPQNITRSGYAAAKACWAATGANPSLNQSKIGTVCAMARSVFDRAKTMSQRSWGVQSRANVLYPRSLPGARVSAYAATGFGGFARRRAERTARTDQRGRFRLSGLSPARYAVAAASEGYLTAQIAGVNASGQTGPPANLALTVLLWLMHRANIARLFAGTEGKISGEQPR